MEGLKIGCYYHIYNHANGDDNLFKESENYRYFLQQYEKHISPVAYTLAYCLMPNHFHLIIKTKSEAEILSTFPKNTITAFPKFETLEKLEEKEIVFGKLISKRFANFFSSYTQAFNKKYDRRGSLFIKNFKRKLILSDRHLITAILYIHNNPVHHGFTQQMTDWQWSSINAIHDSEQGLIHTEELLTIFGSKLAYIEQHQTAEKEKLQRLSIEFEA